MKLIIAYLFALLVIEIYGCIILTCGCLPIELRPITTLMYSVFAAGIGGIIYCLRGVYLSASVRNDWNKAWYPWYYIRPMVSLLMGGVSYVFLRAGLLVLESHSKPNSTHIAFYAVAFIAGLNVDNFLKRIEAIGKSAWGVDQSRASHEDKK